MSINFSGVHHLTLTVSDAEKSSEFYKRVFGLQELARFGDRILMGNDAIVIAVGPAPDPSQAVANDRFNENRIGLDHLSFAVAGKADLDAAMKMFDEAGIEHGEIKDLSGGGIPIYVLAFRDPDNIQLEFTAPQG